MIAGRSPLPRLRALALTAAMALALAAPVADAARPTLDATIAAAMSVAEQRDAAIAEANQLADANKGLAALAPLEAHLDQHPGDIIAGNRYRRLAVRLNQHNQPITFFNAQMKKFDPNPDDDIHGDAPAGLRYNLAFAYIDKIPVVGPMGAGFLSKRSIKQFQVALDQKPNDWIANYGVGMNYLHWPDYFEKNDSSVAYFEKCIELGKADGLRPLDLLPYIRLGDAYAKAGQIDEAIATWKEGIGVFPGHKDLEERLTIKPEKVKKVVTEAYNPNNSIGEINTDISILWATDVPETLFALATGSHFSSFTSGVGGQKAAERDEEESLFVWFQRNLPFLLRRESAETLDMSYLGNNTRDEAGVIAFNMIRGFMTQFHETDAAKVAADLQAAPSYERPFYYEGVGMGLGGKLDTGGESLAGFSEQIAPYGEGFDRLEYAGLGMWYGMAPTPNMVQIKHAFAELSPRGQFYAYEGLGFAVMLFNRKPAQYSINLSRRLPHAAASTYTHGLGRALWIKLGGAQEETEAMFQKVPEKLRGHARSGLGMGISFTRVMEPDAVVEALTAFGAVDAEACRDTLVGAAMGYAVRFDGDPAYVKGTFREAREMRTRKVVPALLNLGLSTMKQVTAGGQEEMHANWRALMTQEIAGPKYAPIRQEICGEANDA